MALADLPFGLRPLFGAQARECALIFPITNNYGTALYINDPVLAVTAGTIEKAGVSAGCMGSILGLYKQDLPLSLKVERLVPQLYMSATPGTANTWFALVAINPDLLFIMQEDGDTSSLILADTFALVDMIYTHGGSTVTGISKAEIDSNTMDATATRPLQLLKPYMEYYDLDSGAYGMVTSSATAGRRARWVVRIANHQFNNTSLSVGLA